MAAAGREFFTVKPVSAALRDFTPQHRTVVETVPLDAAHGRVCANDVLSPADLPGFARSSVDGYAVLASDTFGASEAIPAYLRVTGSVRMGAEPEHQITPRGAVAIPTGGMLPGGADAVVMVEHTQEAMRETVEVTRPVAPGENIVRRDEDARTGAPIARAGQRLGAHDIAILAAAGIRELPVYAPPRVAILPTGDEIAPADAATLPPGHVRDALSLSISALIRDAGGLPAPAPIVPDDDGALQTALTAAIAGSDCVVICAGSSVGMRDQTAAAVAVLDDAAIWGHGLAVKPGKPTLLAHVAGKPIIGLPGNPRSALVIFRLIGMPTVRRIAGERDLPLNGTVRAQLARDVPSAAGRVDVVQVRLLDGRAQPIFGSSALLSVLTAADGYVLIPESANGLSAGESVEVIPYR
jgi:molybdopterin molybdotransferase